MAARGYADADQVVGRQLRQHLAIDIVVAERRRVLFKPQPAQPRRYVHAVILGSEEGQPLMGDDIPLPFELPAAAPEEAFLGFRQGMTAFKAWASRAGHIGNGRNPPF